MEDEWLPRGIAPVADEYPDARRPDGPPDPEDPMESVRCLRVIKGEKWKVGDLFTGKGGGTVLWRIITFDRSWVQARCLKDLTVRWFHISCLSEHDHRGETYYL